jgi:hypothetical protein
LNSAIGYITPKDMRAGHQQEIQAERDRKLDVAREHRKNRRQRAAGRMKRITSGWPTIRQETIRQETIRQELSDPLRTDGWRNTGLPQA